LEIRSTSNLVPVLFEGLYRQYRFWYIGNKKQSGADHIKNLNAFQEEIPKNIPLSASSGGMMVKYFFRHSFHHCFSVTAMTAGYIKTS